MATGRQAFPGSTPRSSSRPSTGSRRRWRPALNPALPPELNGILAEALEKLDEKVAALDDAGWMRKGVMASGGKVMLEQPVGEFLWFILFDAIHHRGQLSTYIRPMGGKVPPIYGPSGDSR
jgi:uncharacterized damage-inducible protein DinB